MPKIAVSPISSDFFVLDGVNYPRLNYELVYANIVATAIDQIDDQVLQIGLRQKYTEELLQFPAVYSAWTDSTDTPFGSLTDLLIALDDIIGFLGGVMVFWDSTEITFDNTQITFDNGTTDD